MMLSAKHPQGAMLGMPHYHIWSMDDGVADAYWIFAESPMQARHLIALNVLAAANAEDVTKFMCEESSRKMPPATHIYRLFNAALTISNRSVVIMPKGPQGQRHPADVIGAAIRAAKIATGEIEEDLPVERSAAAEMGSKGGKARAASMTPKRRAEIAKKAAAKRWGKKKDA
jgi:hypothetical protein